MRRHKKKSRSFVHSMKGVLQYYLISAGLCAVVYFALNQNIAIGVLAKNALLLGIPLALVLLIMQRKLKKVYNESFSKSENSHEW